MNSTLPDLSSNYCKDLQFLLDRCTRDQDLEAETKMILRLCKTGL